MKIIYIFLLILFIPVAIAELQIFSESDATTDNIINLITPEAPINYSLVPTVNSSDFWDDLNVPSDIPGSEFWYNMTYSGSTFNSTYDDWAYNQTIPFTDWLSSFLYDYNQTDTIYFYNMSDGGIVTETDPIFLAENASLWLEAKNKYNSTYAIWAYNMSLPFTNWLSTFLFDYNQTTPAIDYSNTNFYNKSANINMTQGTNISIGGCNTWWNGTCEVKSCPTTTNYYC